MAAVRIPDFRAVADADNVRVSESVGFCPFVFSTLASRYSSYSVVGVSLV